MLSTVASSLLDFEMMKTIRLQHFVTATFVVLALVVSLVVSTASATTMRTTAAGDSSLFASKPTLRKAELLYRIETDDPVVFITIDDGYDVNGNGLDLLERWRWPVTSFLLPFNSQDHVPYFQNVGRVNDIGSHTGKHTILKGLNVKKQTAAICDGEKQLKQQFGGTTGFFRPPTGSWDENTLIAAAACGISHVFLWRVSMNGSTMTTWGPPPQRGDIILIHYVGSLEKSLKRIAWELKKQGLRVARLADYIPARRVLPMR